MTVFALASEYSRLSPAEQDRVTHIIADDGDWTPEQISAYLQRWRDADIHYELSPDDWTTKAGELL